MSDIKIVRLGRTDEGNVFCKIEQKKTEKGLELSIVGVVGPTYNGNCCGSCGQIVMSFDSGDINDFGPGFDKAKVDKFLKVWDRWHLNDLTAGSPRQEMFVRGVRASNEESIDYNKICEMLKQEDLLVDEEHEDYRYGSAWLFEEVPKSVLQFLSELEETDITPAWV